MFKSNSDGKKNKKAEAFRKGQQSSEVLKCGRLVGRVGEDYENNLETFIHFTETFCSQWLCPFSISRDLVPDYF